MALPLLLLGLAFPLFYSDGKKPISTSFELIRANRKTPQGIEEASPTTIPKRGVCPGSFLGCGPLRRPDVLFPVG
jgi:hypothetical protein